MSSIPHSLVSGETMLVRKKHSKLFLLKPTLYFVVAISAYTYHYFFERTMDPFVSLFVLLGSLALAIYALKIFIVRLRILRVEEIVLTNKRIIIDTGGSIFSIDLEKCGGVGCGTHFWQSFLKLGYVSFSGVGANTIWFGFLKGYFTFYNQIQAAIEEKKNAQLNPVNHGNDEG